MKALIFLTLLSFIIYSDSRATPPPRELPVGTTFAIKYDFWLYEIRGLFYRDERARYLIQTSTEGGIGSDTYKYVSTFPAGTRLEVISLKKKSKRRWSYAVRTVNYINPKIGDAPVIIAEWSMLEEPWGLHRGSYRPTQTTRLDPDLFTDFVYPEE